MLSFQKLRVDLTPGYSLKFQVLTLLSSQTSPGALDVNVNDLI